MFFIFILLIAGPIIASSHIKAPSLGSFSYLQQPVGLNNNDTTMNHTGNGNVNQALETPASAASGGLSGGSQPSAAIPSSEATGGARMLRYMAY